MVAGSATGLARGLRILLALEAADGEGNAELGVSRIAELVEREKSQVSRSLKTLDNFGFVDRDPDTRA